MKPKTPDTVLRPTQASQPACLIFSRNLVWVVRGRSAHRVRPLSTDPHRQELSVNGVSASFGLGTPSTWQLALPRRTSSRGTSNQCLLPKLPRLRAPVLACSRCVQEACASCGAVVFGDRRVAGGGGVHSAHLRFSGPYSPLASRLTIAAGILSPTRPIRPTSDIRVAPLEPVFDGPSFTPSRGSSRTRAAKVSFADTV